MLFANGHFMKIAANSFADRLAIRQGDVDPLFALSASSPSTMTKTKRRSHQLVQLPGYGLREKLEEMRDDRNARSERASHGWRFCPAGLARISMSIDVVHAAYLPRR